MMCLIANTIYMSEVADRVQEEKIERGDKRRAAEDEQTDRLKDAKHEQPERAHNTAKPQEVHQAERERDADHRVDLRDKARA